MPTLVNKLYQNKTEIEGDLLENRNDQPTTIHYIELQNITLNVLRVIWN